jgi:hypothetical protein
MTAIGTYVNESARKPSSLPGIVPVIYNLDAPSLGGTTRAVFLA